MEEKELTDDTEIDVGMIIKALKYCLDDNKSECIGCLFRRNNECTYDQKYGMSIVLDLIHRLQSENETQRKIIEYQDGLADMVEQQKSEIERLKNERIDLIGRNAGLCSSNNRLKERISKYKMQVDELNKRLIDEFENFKVEVYQKVKKQAEKDTAKEILQELFDEATSNVSETVELTTFQIEQFAERYGVEVE